MARRDLNYFERHAQQGENHLTRAALSLMRLVPSAHGEFLRLVDITLALTGLPEHIDFDFQTSHPHPELEARLSAGEVTADVEVISVYLTPDEIERPITVVEAARHPIYDGVIRYGDELVVLIETKLNEWDDSTQAEEINLGGLSGHCRLRPVGAHVRWHDLLEAWVRLDERSILGPTERSLLSDFFDTTENDIRFAALLPFTTLQRAGRNPHRRDRRLKALLQTATGRDVDFDWAWYAWDDGTWTTFSRMYLWGDHSDCLYLGAWPGERQGEARVLYGTPDLARRLVDLDSQSTGHANWRVAPNVGLNVRVPGTRVDLSCALPAGEYVELWSGSLDQLHQYGADDLEPLFDWLVANGLADAATDREEYDRLLVIPRRKQVNLRAGLQVVATWQWEEAVQLDHGGLLQREIQEAAALLAALGEGRRAA